MINIYRRKIWFEAKGSGVSSNKVEYPDPRDRTCVKYVEAEFGCVLENSYDLLGRDTSCSAKNSLLGEQQQLAEAAARTGFFTKRSQLHVPVTGDARAGLKKQMSGVIVRL